MGGVILEECFKPKIKKEKFQEWLNFYEISDEGQMIIEMKDLQKRGYDISNIITLVDNFE